MRLTMNQLKRIIRETVIREGQLGGNKEHALTVLKKVTAEIERIPDEEFDEAIHGVQFVEVGGDGVINLMLGKVAP